MKILLEVQENKAGFLIELLKSISYVKKATPISASKAEIMKDISKAIEEFKLIREGELKGIPVKNLLDEI